MPQYRLEPTPTTPPIPINDNGVGHAKFENILPKEQWQSLPQAVRNRFSKTLGAPEAQLYSGYVINTHRNFPGTVLVHLLRLIGAPLPLDTDNADQTAIVTVTAEPSGNGQIWTRHYGRKTGFPQIIQSAKRFSGSTGLEEYIGFGISMALNLRVEDGTLLFESQYYTLGKGKIRFKLPKFLSPGHLTVSHADHGDGWFEFGLTLIHPLMGTLFKQTIMFRDVEST